MGDQLTKYELHICYDILIIYNFIANMPPFYSINLVFKRNLRYLNKEHWLVFLLDGKQIYWEDFIVKDIWVHCCCASSSAQTDVELLSGHNDFMAAFLCVYYLTPIHSSMWRKISNHKDSVL